MAATITREDTKWSLGQLKVLGTLNLGSYATGGVSVTAGLFGLSRIEDLIIDPAGGYTFEFDKTNSKIKAYRSGSHTHDLHLNDADVADGATTRVNAGTNLLGAGTGTDILVAGVADASGAGGIVAAAAGALAQVAASVDLSAVTARFRAFGY